MRALHGSKASVVNSHLFGELQAGHGEYSSNFVANTYKFHCDR